MGQLRIRSFLQQDLPANTSAASSRVNINLASDQLVLSVPRSLFSHWFHCGQFELFRTENAELGYVHEPPGPGSRGELGISGDFYAMGTHLCTAEEDPESQD